MNAIPVKLILGVLLFAMASYAVPTGGDLPLVLVFAPNGVVTGGFPKQVTSDQLKQSVNVSELMLKILKPLQEQKVVLVALQNQSTRFPL
ncbi:MAG: hypothetical protein A2293_04145 [Elusimicrobia bacterium RIFOXYB2_FULL_49_7]|nr:MAG: hypothetical protein A2293_04145 [Elusimicrobia bacterium RIFOXYB2_FULL_49_7]